MADPVVESITPTTDIAPADATPDANLPGTINADDLLILAVAVHPGTASHPVSVTGWTEFDEGANTQTGGAKFWRKATGGEGSTVTVTYNATPDAFAAQVYRISNWDTGQDPESTIITELNGGATTTTPDPPPITQSWGAGDNLFITFIYMSDDAAAVTVYPSGWTPGADTVADGGANESVQLSSAHLLDNSSTTVNPGAFTIDDAETGHGSTMAILGGAGAQDFMPASHVTEYVRT